VSGPGLFVTLEGIEGCGKSTQARLLAESLRDTDRRDVVLTREPGGTDVTQRIRALLADPTSHLDARCELLLFLADRAQHVATVIRPALERGAVVVCDRYSDSTLAYQGYARGHSLDLLRDLNEWASYGLRPDLTFWIDCPVETGLTRANKRSGGPGDRFEKEPLAFHEKVSAGFAELATADPQRFVHVDGTRSKDVVAAEIRAVTLARLSQRGGSR
jgi:dTMP kinase